MKEYLNKTILVFDLDDTLAKSKCDITKGMASVLNELLKHYMIAIISGAGYKQLINQAVVPMEKHAKSFRLNKWKFFLLPSSGLEFYAFDEEKYDWYQVYQEVLTLRQKYEICDAWVEATRYRAAMPDKHYGEIFEDRGGQITFSAMGQQAPIEVKQSWDPDQSIRHEIKRCMDSILHGKYEVTIGGSTSIDVSKSGQTKAYGLRKFLEHPRVNISEDNVLFFGDALFEGGNDYPIKEMGVDSIEVKNPRETMKLLKQLIKAEKERQDGKI